MFSYSSPSLQAQVASLLHTDNSNLFQILLMYTSKINTVIMESLALHNAVALCFDTRPGTLMFEQGLMHHHLISCLQHLKFTLFPIKRKRRRNLKVHNTESIKVVCICRMPDIPHQPGMICCFRCSV